MSDVDPSVCNQPADDGRLCALPIYHRDERHAYYDPPAAGICGDPAISVDLYGKGAPHGVCTLLAGHAGWHAADDGMSWTHGEAPGAPPLEDDPSLIDWPATT